MANALDTLQPYVEQLFDDDEARKQLARAAFAAGQTVTAGPQRRRRRPRRTRALSLIGQGQPQPQEG
jgi:hypothetical protein